MTMQILKREYPVFKAIFLRTSVLGLFTALLTVSLLLSSCQTSDTLETKSPSTFSETTFSETAPTSSYIKPSISLTTDTTYLTIETSHTESVSSTITTTTQAPTASTVLPDKLDERFDRMTDALILTGLTEKQQSISMNEITQSYMLVEDLLFEVVDRIYMRYQHIYFSNPDYFYLNGQFAIDYNFQKGRLIDLSIMPEMWESLTQLSNQEIDQYIGKVNLEADRWAATVNAEAETDTQKLVLLHDLLARHITYDFNSENHAGDALLKGKTVCGGYSQAYQLIAKKLGYKVDTIYGLAEDLAHLWNLVYLDGRVYHVDVTYDDVYSDEFELMATHQYLFRSDAAMRETHSWDSTIYPLCKDDGLFYYRDNGLLVSDIQGLKTVITDFMHHVDFSRESAYAIEVFFEGSDCPDVNTFNDIVSDIIIKIRPEHDFCYWAGSKMGVLFIQLKTKCYE